MMTYSLRLPVVRIMLYNRPPYATSQAAMNYISEKIFNNTLMERKLRMPQIQGVQGRMPYAAAKQQPSTCEPLATKEMGYPAVRKNSRFPEG
jgi:hypothetical protein